MRLVQAKTPELTTFRDENAVSPGWGGDTTAEHEI